MYSTQGVMMNSHPLLAILFGMLGLCVAALAATSWKERREAQRKLPSRGQRATKRS
jgi:uncharacterized iron-regulated membrane protein